MDIEIKELKASLKETGDQLKAFAESSKLEIKNHAKLSEETKASVDKLLTEQGALRERMAAAEQLVAKLENGEADYKNGRVLSLGDAVVGSDEFKRMNINSKGKFTTEVNAVILSGNDSGGALIQPVRAPMVTPQTRRLMVEDLLSSGNLGPTNSVEYARESGFTNAAAPVAEGALKHESDIVFELLSAPVVTIAHWIYASRQVLSDATMLSSYINTRLTYGALLAKENQILNGSGTGLNMNGLVTQATAYANPGVTVDNETVIDRIRLAMLQVQLAEYAADGIVLNPIDWAQIELTKDAELRYMIANPTASTTPTLWGMPVVSTTAMTAGEFLVGAFQMGAQVWNREGVSVTVSTEDGDNFRRNMVTILAELRAALTVYRPEAFVTGDTGIVD